MLLKSARIKLIPGNRNGISLPLEFKILNKYDNIIGATSFVETGKNIPEFQIIIFDERNRHHGIGSEVIRLMIEYGFDTLDYEEIELYVFPFEKNAIKAYLKSGFRLRRVIMQNHYNDERYKTIMAMGINKKEYERMSI
ncbi:MAG: GNAT family protein [Kosmotogaceae bacterium]